MLIKLTVTLVCLFLHSAPAQAEQSFIQRQMEAFKHSNIEFGRSGSNVPFPPFAFLGGSHYGKAKVENSNRGIDLDYDVSSIGQAAALPMLLGDSDALLVGEYISYSDFDVDGADVDSFNVKTFGIPVAWLRQVNPDWQVAAFAMPLGHDNSLDNGGWTWQTLGGGFTRWVQHDHLWWVFGLYFDIAPDENFYIPYVGASWQINHQWTLSAVMPWPALLYAPTQDWLLRFGASPSSASWSVAPDKGDVTLNMDAWDFGLGVERRLTGNFWASVEAGIGGLRGLRITGNDVKSPDTDVGSSWYVALDFKIRAGLLE